jgi:hypothetical protein
MHAIIKQTMNENSPMKTVIHYTIKHNARIKLLSTAGKHNISAGMRVVMDQASTESPAQSICSLQHIYTTI